MPVLTAAGRYDRALVLGDLVGYGADPNAVIDRVRALPAATFIRGNHDKVGAGLENTDGFNYLARHAITWTTATLTPERRHWLAALPQGPVIIDDLVEICHGAPFDEDVYIFDDLDAIRALRVARRPLCLFGHTHVVAGYHVTNDMRSVGGIPDPPIYIPPDGGSRFLVNCGAVGQPATATRERVRHPRHGLQNAVARARVDITCSPRRQRLSPPAFRMCSRSGWRWGDDNYQRPTTNFQPPTSHAWFLGVLEVGSWTLDVGRSCLPGRRGMQQQRTRYRDCERD